MTYEGQVLALTRHFAKLSISPESSDGFASVGTILPKEEATLLPGGLFAFSGYNFRVIQTPKNLLHARARRKKVSKARCLHVAKPDGIWPMQKVGGDIRGAPKKEAHYVSCSAYCIAGDDRSSISGIFSRLTSLPVIESSTRMIGTRTIFHRAVTLVCRMC